MNILNEIVMRTRIRISEKKKDVPLREMAEAAEQLPRSSGFPFEKALRNDDIAFICEIKKASPSKGMLVRDLDHVGIAAEYYNAGAAAISVLTEPYFFHGNDSYLTDVADKVPIPVLRKDFVVDEYMVYEAKLLGASAVLLMCSVLDHDLLSRCIDTAHRLGLSALVEVRDEDEIAAALDAGARVIGVNNRDMTTFETDIMTTVRLRPLVPKEKLFVSESGIRVNGEINTLRKINVNAVLIGEALMRSSDKAKELRMLRGDVRV
ncbi:MAG: indole-3-glycerol phosphate synthase TrpC [Methanomassiliicoccaceae archaeon]|jgi:indole-3-glycerol phosphate synthase|nr:indole-3-glycerol phosphate synthase TrpC [Methanomassiliicoccaceae archaeon]